MSDQRELVETSVVLRVVAVECCKYRFLFKFFVDHVVISTFAERLDVGLEVLAGVLALKLLHVRLSSMLAL